MKQTKKKTIDFEIAEILKRLGFKRTVSYLLTYFLEFPEPAFTKDIELATGLQQPQVSIALSTLNNRGWINNIKIPKRSGKGRPTNQYSLSMNHNEFVEYLEKMQLEKVSMANDDINKLRIKIK